MKNFWDKCDSFPPVLVRLLARHIHGPPLTDAEISRSSGLPIHQVYTISCSTNWQGIDVPTMRKFVTACHVDFEDPEEMERIRSYLRKPTYKYLRRSKLWDSYFKPLYLRYRKSVMP